MIVYQIILDTPPEICLPCIKSVQDYAVRSGAEYVCHTDCPDMYAHYKHREAIANAMRVDFARQHDDVVYADWDVQIGDTFEWPAGDKLYCDKWNPEAFFRTNGYTDFLNHVWEDYIEYCLDVKTHAKEWCRINKIWRRLMPNYDCVQTVNEEKYIHYFGKRKWPSQSASQL
ncbi:MAG: hypothetical protein ABIH23_15570 [bacterium]